MRNASNLENAGSAKDCEIYNMDFVRCERSVSWVRRDASSWDEKMRRGNLWDDYGELSILDQQHLVVQ
jgi:hypothetical protein